MRKWPARPAHLPDILLAGHRVNDGAGAEKQQGLEKGMGKEMQHADAVSAHPHGDKHVAELRAGRIGDDPLDVILHHGHCSGEERRDRANNRNDRLRVWRILKQRRHSSHQEDPGSHHGGGVYQG